MDQKVNTYCVHRTIHFLKQNDEHHTPGPSAGARCLRSHLARHSLLRPSRLVVAQMAALQKQFMSQVAGGGQLGAEGKKNA